MSIQVPQHQPVRVYRVIEGNVEDGSRLTLELARSFDTVGLARKWVKSHDCFLTQIRDRGATRADFLIVQNKEHYRILPVTLMVTENLDEAHLRASRKTQRGSVVSDP